MELTVEEALRKGIEAHRAGNVVEADKYYTAILSSQPDHPDANHNMGVLAVGVGKVEEALPFFKRALDANAAVEQFWLSYIDALIKLDKMDEAKAVFDQAKSKKAKIPLKLLNELLVTMKKGCLCALCGAIPTPIMNILKYFGDEMKNDMVKDN